MSRRRDVPKRQPAPDARYQSALVSSFINKVMLDGKKSTAESIVYGAFDRIKDKTGGEPLTTFREAVQNVKPTLEVKSRRKGGERPGALRGASRAAYITVPALDRRVRPETAGEDDGGEAGG